MRKARKANRRGPRRRLPPTRQSTNVSAVRRVDSQPYESLPALQLIYDTAPIGLAFLTPDCRYLQINKHLTEICGIPVSEHIGRTVRETVPQVADDVENLVQAILRTGEPITGVEVRGQRADGSNADHVWVTSWHPLKNPDGKVVGINVVAEEVTERKRAEAVLTANENALRESEARFRELADNISQFAWTADATGWIYWYNKRWHDYTGTTLEEMQGWGWRKAHHPDHVERVVRRIRRSFETGTVWEDTFPLRGRNGRYRWFLSRALPIRNDAGQVVRWFGTNTDITEQIEAEKALRELNETLEQRVEAETRERLQIWSVSQDLLVVADLEGTYLSVNPAWTATLGWPDCDLIGKTSEWLLHPDDRDKTRAEIRRLAAGGKTSLFENRLRCRDGSYRWLSWNSAKDQGRIYAMARDVTELKEAENDLHETRQELAQTARRTALAAMTASIAHEIKQPLAATVANANAALRWLARTPPNFDEVRAALGRIVADGHRAGEVIQSVRTMFGNDEQTGAPLDANALIQATIAIIRGELEAARIAVQLELTAPLPLIPAHRGQLQQVILNLVTNAADALRTVVDRERILKVKSEVFQTDGVAVSVWDSGPGIEPENVQRVFDAFFSTKSDGMGMGLAISRSIVEAHGGHLSVSPGVPHGCVFRVELPGSR